MAWHFDETNDDVQITDDAVLTLPNGDWTIGGWFRLTDNTGSNFQYILSWGTFGADPSFQWFLPEASTADANTLKIIVRDAGGDEHNFFSSGTPGTSTAWQHFALVRSGTTLTQYIDGSADGSNTNANHGSVDVAGNFYVGSRSDRQSARFFGGDVAELAKWDRALNASELTSLVAGTRPGRFSDSLQWYLPMDIGGTSGLYVDHGPNRLTVANTGSTHANHAPVVARRTPSVIYPTAVAGGRIMSSLVNAGGLAGVGGIAGRGGGLAG